MTSPIDCFRSTQEGAIGKAIYDYRRALKIDPDVRPEPYADSVVSRFPKADREEILNMLEYAAQTVRH